MAGNIHKNPILILDFGSQYTFLIARRVREIGVYCEIFPYDIDEDSIKNFGAAGCILSGGPNSSVAEDSPRIPECIFKQNIPILGICYGMQALTVQLGGKVEVCSKKREYGYSKIKILSECKLFDTINDNDEDINSKDKTIDVWMSHSDKIQKVPENFITIGSTDTCQHAIMMNKEETIYGVQFHPEVTHTKKGTIIFKNFILNICKCESLWKPENIIDDIINKINKKVKNERVILALSGGVDSSTTALLLQKAIGNNLLCIFVDNGLLRLNESEQVMNMFENKFGLNIIKIDAQEKFFDKLSGISDPEMKRKIIGNIFIDIFAEKAKEYNDIKWLSQGTIYPDVIESASSNTKKAHVIKSHHNVGGLPEKMSLKLIEPLRELFKDEIRKIGLVLGLPYDMIYRHPFPGPGLGVRILGEVKKEYCDILRLADSIFIEELINDNLYHKVSQAFAVFLSVRSVSVLGDQRKYDWVIALRAVETIDFMTATWAELPHSFLSKVSNRIINEVQGISRVVYDISGKPPSTIEWE